MTPRWALAGIAATALLAALEVGRAAGMAAPVAELDQAPAIPRVLPEPPLGRDGATTRPLSDDELWRLLLALSATNEAATALIVRCHAAGTPFGRPDWRACIMAD